MRKLLFFVLIKGHAKVVNMYFLITRSYRETNNSIQLYKFHVTKNYNKNIL